MIIIGRLLTAVSCLCGIGAVRSGSGVEAVAALFCAGAGIATIWAFQSSRFVQIIIVYFSVEAIVFGSIICGQSFEVIPVVLVAESLAPIAITAALISILAATVTPIPIVKQVLAIADRYFCDATPVRLPLLRGYTVSEGTIGALIIWLVLAIQQLELYWNIKLTYASALMADAMQNYDVAKFWHAILVEFPLYSTPYLLATVIVYAIGSVLAIRWRRALTRDYERRWLSSHAHYRMLIAGVGADNPDQRVQEDIPRFIDGNGGGLGLYSFSVNFIAQLNLLISFSVLLWTLSDSFKIGGTPVPGLLLWATIAYAALNTGLTALIGRSFTRLAFARQHYEADFRFSLARLREYSEQIALLSSEEAERRTLAAQFNAIIANFYALVSKRTMLQLFHRFLTSVNDYMPYMVLGGLYFTREITLGTIGQSMAAFSRVNGCLTYFISYYVGLAEFRSSVDRLTSFDRAIDQADAESVTGESIIVPGGHIALTNVLVMLPDRSSLWEPVTLTLEAGTSVLVTGPSGSGKSTLFRLVAGIWPYWSGSVQKPAANELMILPQKPYLPTGSLMKAVCYPGRPESYDLDEVAAVMGDLGLGALVSDLALDDCWAQRLSGGEQQRVAVARALLAKPRWLFLDEATSAQDRGNEDRIYDLLRTRLPNTTLISIAHDERLAKRHERHLNVQMTREGYFALVDASCKRLLDEVCRPEPQDRCVAVTV